MELFDTMNRPQTPAVFDTLHERPVTLQVNHLSVVAPKDPKKHKCWLCQQLGHIPVDCRYFDYNPFTLQFKRGMTGTKEERDIFIAHNLHAKEEDRFPWLPSGMNEWFPGVAGVLCLLKRKGFEYERDWEWLEAALEKRHEQGRQEAAPRTERKREREEESEEEEVVVEVLEAHPRSEADDAISAVLRISESPVSCTQRSVQLPDSVKQMDEDELKEAIRQLQKRQSAMQLIRTETSIRRQEEARLAILEEKRLTAQRKMEALKEQEAKAQAAAQAKYAQIERARARLQH